MKFLRPTLLALILIFSINASATPFDACRVLLGDFHQWVLGTDKLPPQEEILPENRSKNGIDGARFIQEYKETKYKFELFQMIKDDEYVGEDHFGYPTDNIIYLKENERESFKIYPMNGRFYHSKHRGYDAASNIIDYYPIVSYIRNAKTRFGRTLFVVDPIPFVMDKSGNFYLLREKRSRRYRHSSILAAGEVAAAGEIAFRDGVPVYINNASGHYRPPKKALDQVIMRLNELGFDTSKIIVSVRGK